MLHRCTKLILDRGCIPKPGGACAISASDRFEIKGRIVEIKANKASLVKADVEGAASEILEDPVFTVHKADEHHRDLIPGGTPDRVDGELSTSITDETDRRLAGRECQPNP